MVFHVVVDTIKFTGHEHNECIYAVFLPKLTNKTKKLQINGVNIPAIFGLKSLKTWLDYFLNGLKYPETWLKPRFPKVLRIEDQELQI